MLAGLAASNIGWPHTEFGEALMLLRELGFTGVEIAPRNVFESWNVPDDEVRAFRVQIEEAGLVCPALQGILFDAPGATLFESGESRRRLQHHLDRVAQIASLLGAPACVFGAPRQRDPGDLEPKRAFEIAVDFLRSIAPSFHGRGTELAFEANARRYACRFVTTTREAVHLVHAVNSPGIALQIDTGTILLEDEDPKVLCDAAKLAVHAHVSEPDLQPVGARAFDHRPLGLALKESGYSGFLSIEMRATPDWQGALRTAAATVKREYL